jgi:hypothetical protein
MATAEERRIFMLENVGDLRDSIKNAMGLGDG